jgi:hypothetical protein
LMVQLWGPWESPRRLKCWRTCVQWGPWWPLGWKWAWQGMEIMCERKRKMELLPEISENKSSVSHDQVMYAKCHSDLAHGLNRNLLHVEPHYQILHMA